MAWAASIRVVDEHGDAVSGAKVTVIFSLMTGHDTEYTNDDGWAEFEYESIDSEKSLWVDDIYINGERVAGDFYIENGDTESYAAP
ncbi:MAG: hypothetical protein ACXWC8_21300 [Limisphaerales bacterium]